MTRINVSDSFRVCNTNTHFEMKFREKADMNKALEAAKEAIEAINYEGGYAALWMQDLDDSCAEISLDIDSTLMNDEYAEYIPVMLKAIAKALPDASFEGYAEYSDTRCYYVHDFDFSYNGKQLYIKSTFMDDEKGYFCPDCGYQVAGPDHVFDSDEIECDDCEEIIKVADLKYIPADVTEETIDI